MHEMVPESICVPPEQTPHWRDVDCQQASWCLGLTHNLGLPIELMDVYMMLVDVFDAIKFFVAIRFDFCFSRLFCVLVCMLTMPDKKAHSILT